MKKAFLPALIISLLLAALTACGGSAQPVEPQEPSKAVETPAPEAAQPESAPAAPEPEADSPDMDEVMAEIERENLYIAYQTAYDCGAEYESATLEEQLDKEVSDLQIIASGYVTLPEDYAEDYKAWRLEHCGDGFNGAPVEAAPVKAAGAAAEAPVEAPPAASSSGGSAQTGGGSQSGTKGSLVKPEDNWGDFIPNADLTEEEIQAKLEEDYQKVECKNIH